MEQNNYSMKDKLRNFEPKKPESGTQEDLLPKSGEQIKEIILQVMRGEIFTEQAEQQLLALIEKEKMKEDLKFVEEHSQLRNMIIDLRKRIVRLEKLRDKNSNRLKNF